MNKNNIILTIILIILIAVAIFAIYTFKGSANISRVNPYEEAYKHIVPNKEEKNICLTSFSTKITYPDENRTHNIKTGCKYLNGLVIYQGDTFSFNEALGPFNEYQGYIESTGFNSEGEIIKIVGGGICQVSSTLYNCALNYNLEIVERHAHSAPVDYVPQGKDATILYDTVDLKFKNTTNKEITIKSYFKDESITVEFWTKE
ncbi:MAG: VanW family protein [Clostridia bacterium]|nr:VanW family protein [Clostridia bacterium]